MNYGNQDPLYYNQPKMFMPQLNWITDNQENILVNCICRFENLEEDFSNVCRIIGKNVTLPHVKASPRGNYREYYDDTTIEIVAKWFTKDIERFDYHF